MFSNNPTIVIGRHLRAFAGLSASLVPMLILAGLSGPRIVRAQDVKLPPGEAVLDRHVQATGGKAAYAKVHNRVTKGTLEMVGQGIKFSMTSYAARPNKMYAVMESETFGKIEKGSDGQVAWELGLMTGPVVKEGEERALMLRGATFDAVPDWRKLYKQAECIGLEPVDGRACYKVVLTPRDGASGETRYYDQETHRVAMIEMSLELPSGTIPMELYPSDYRQVDGILISHKTRVVVLGTERLMTTESVEHNVKLPADRFALPEEIQALVDHPKPNPAKTAKP
jgi:hypothetical protein